MNRQSLKPTLKSASVERGRQGKHPFVGDAGTRIVITTKIHTGLKNMKRVINMKTKKQVRRKNPSDLTLRNLRAMKKRVDRLEQWLEAVTLDLDEVYSHIKGATCRISLRSRIKAGGGE